MSDFFELGQNVGIVLDGQYIAVDLDRPDTLEGLRLAKQLDGIATWRQKTPHGRHWLFRTPAGLAIGNVKLRAADGSTFGDIKTLGYIVAPESAVGGIKYLLEAELDPIAAPPWVLETARSAARSERTALESAGRSEIPTGEHDAFLTRLAGYLRGKEALDAPAIARVLGGAVEVLDRIDPRRPYTDGDLQRIARSIEKKPARLSGEIDSLGVASWICGTDVAIVGEPVRWWVRDFVPRGELVMLYGPGGIGKSSAGSWLAAEVTQAGGTFAFVGVEEPFSRFLGRAVLAGADRSRMFSIPANAVTFPKSAEALRGEILQAKLDVLYVDSIYSHFEHLEGLNTAERARRCLAPLAEIAQGTGCSIVAVFHENKAGEFLGSVEMVNVARHVLRASRKGTGPLRLDVKKSNIRTPSYALTLNGTLTVLRDPITNDVQMEDGPDGYEEMSMVIPSRGENATSALLDPSEIAAPHPVRGEL